MEINHKSAKQNFSADDILFIYLFFFFQKKKCLDIPCESSANADDSHEMSRLIFSEKKKLNK